MVGAGEFDEVAGVGDACNPKEPVVCAPEGLPGGDSSSADACCCLLSCVEANAVELAAAIGGCDVSSSSFSCVAVVCDSSGILTGASASATEDGDAVDVIDRGESFGVLF